MSKIDATDVAMLYLTLCAGCVGFGLGMITTVIVALVVT